MQAEPPASQRCADVVLLVGPSGCGKTYLAREAGLPVLALDDFYRAGDRPDLPLDAHGQVDWEDPRTWDADAALAALEAFCCGDDVVVPDYSFHENRAVGTKVLHRGGARVVVAEGIFAGEIIERLRADGLLADALLIRQNRWKTFVLRLWRDAREARKSWGYLVRQGWAKALAEPAIVARQRSQGARPVSKAAALDRLHELARRPEPATEAEAISPLPGDPLAAPPP